MLVGWKIRGEKTIKRIPINESMECHIFGFLSTVTRTNMRIMRGWLLDLLTTAVSYKKFVGQNPGFLPKS